MGTSVEIHCQAEGVRSELDLQFLLLSKIFQGKSCRQTLFALGVTNYETINVKD